MSLRNSIGVLMCVGVGGVACNAILGTDEAYLAEEVKDSGTATTLPTQSEPAPTATSSSPARIEDAEAPIDAGPCAGGQKLCQGMCVSILDPLFGCNTESCEPCSLPSAKAVCAGGRCAVGECSTGFADCNRDTTDGCETDLSRAETCGACNAVCPVAAPLCVPELPAFRCATGCNEGAPTLCGAQCVDLQTSATHCGACNHACPAPANGDAVCGGASCGIRCRTGFHACGGACLADTSVEACGASCTPCAGGANATPSCDGRACKLTCTAGWADCDLNLANGCESRAADDPANCGGCGKACKANETCAAGKCKAPPTPDAGPGPSDAGSGDGGDGG